LSGGLALNSIDQMEIFEINNVLSKWTHLKILRIFNNWHPHWRAKGPDESHLLLFRDTEFDLNLKEIEPFLCPWLKKIIIPINIIPTFLPGHHCTINENDVDHLNQMLPTWARVSKIWFDPYSKSQKVGIENISELCLELGLMQEQFNGSLENIGASMINLESLAILIDYVERDDHPNHNIDYCLPLLRNLPENLHLEFFVQDDPIGKEYFYSFVSKVAPKISSLRFGIRYLLDDFVHLADLRWLKYFKNMEKFEIINIRLSIWPQDNYWAVEEFCQNPLTKLKEFECPEQAFFSQDFLLRLREAFPVIETFSIHYWDPDRAIYWNIDNFITILQTLLTVKNLTFRNVLIKISGSSDLTAIETGNIFALAFDILKKFPVDSTYKFVDLEYGYKIVKEEQCREGQQKMFRKKCDNRCTIKYLGYHNICKVPLSRLKFHPYTIIDEFHKLETVKCNSNINLEVNVRKKPKLDISEELTENIFAVLFDIIKKFPIEAILRVIDNVHGYKIIKEEMKPPRIYHKLCNERCTTKFSYHTECTIPPKKVKERRPRSPPPAPPTNP